MRSEVADVTGNIKYIRKTVFFTVRQSNVHYKPTFTIKAVFTP